MAKGHEHARNDALGRLLLVLMSVLPMWGYRRGWGLVPGGIVVLVLSALIVAILMKWM